MNLKDLVAEIAAQSRWTYEKSGDAFIFTVPQPKNRKQRVSVSEFDHEKQKLIRIVSTVGPRKGLDPDRISQALSLNLHLPYGCLALTESDLVMTETRPLKTTTPTTTGDAIRYIARQADLYEHMLFGHDAH